MKKGTVHAQQKHQQKGADRRQLIHCIGVVLAIGIVLVGRQQTAQVSQTPNG